MIRFRSNAALACFLMLAGLSNARAADVEKGKALFEKCAACHSLDAGKNQDAPSLFGIFGRKIASVEEYRYSAAMKRSDVVWADRTLDTFIEDPQAFIPGNRMPFDGLKDKSEREDLLAYLELATKSANDARGRIHGIIHGMKTTIDSAGRLVIPRDIRQKANLKAGMSLDVRWKDGRIEIEPEPLPVRFVRQGRLLIARPAKDTPTLSGETVEETRRSIRRDRSSG